MSENTNVNAQETTAEQKNEISLDYIFAEIKAIREQTEYLNEALRMLHCVESEGPGDIGAQEKAKGIAEVVKCRETTNQQLLKFYEKVYDDLLQREKMQRNDKIELVKGIWMSYLEKTDDVLPEDDKLDAANYVRSQLELLCADILNDKI